MIMGLVIVRKETSLGAGAGEQRWRKGEAERHALAVLGLIASW